jgi:hypothetical protein
MLISIALISSDSKFSLCLAETAKASKVYLNLSKIDFNVATSSKFCVVDGVESNIFAPRELGRF